MRPALVLALLLAAAACARPARPDARRADAPARFDSATAARLCADAAEARAARAGTSGCELRDQSPEPPVRPRPRP